MRVRSKLFDPKPKFRFHILFGRIYNQRLGFCMTNFRSKLHNHFILKIKFWCSSFVKVTSYLPPLRFPQTHAIPRYISLFRDRLFCPTITVFYSPLHLYPLQTLSLRWEDVSWTTTVCPPTRLLCPVEVKDTTVTPGLTHRLKSIQVGHGVFLIPSNIEALSFLCICILWGLSNIYIYKTHTHSLVELFQLLFLFRKTLLLRRSRIRDLFACNQHW